LDNKDHQEYQLIVNNLHQSPNLSPVNYFNNTNHKLLEESNNNNGPILNTGRESYKHHRSHSNKLSPHETTSQDCGYQSYKDERTNTTLHQHSASNNTRFSAHKLTHQEYGHQSYNGYNTNRSSRHNTSSNNNRMHTNDQATRSYNNQDYINQDNNQQLRQHNNYSNTKRSLNSSSPPPSHYQTNHTRTYNNSNNHRPYQSGNYTAQSGLNNQQRNKKPLLEDQLPLQYIPKKLTIESSLEIKQIRERVFMIGNLDSFLSINSYYNTILYNLANLLDKGGKFVPCY